MPTVSISPPGGARGQGGGACGGACSDTRTVYLFAHGVDPIRPQKRHCLLHQVCPPTVQHPETQVLFELGFDGHRVQLPRSEKAVVGPKEGRDRWSAGCSSSPRDWSLKARGVRKHQEAMHLLFLSTASS